ncbi:MAG: hypothetical protein U1E76_00045 [Planctomycetota bacterium]
MNAIPLLTVVWLAQVPAASNPALLIYPGDFTLVQEVRSVTLPAGRSSIRLDVVRGNVDQASLEVEPLDHPAEIKVVAMLRRAEQPSATFVEVESSIATDERLRLSYVVHGLSASVRYTLALDAARKTLDLVQELEVGNGSGQSFDGAVVRSLFGDVRTVNPNAVLHGRAADPAPGAPPGLPAEPLRQDLLEHAVVAFGAPVALQDGITVRRPATELRGIPVVLEYRFDATQSARVMRVLKVANQAGSGLGGVSLQAGALFFVEREPGGLEVPVRVGSLAQLPAGKELELDAGVANDVVIERDQVDLVRTDLVFGEYNRALVSYAVEEAYRLEIRGHASEPRSLVITEHVDQTDTFDVIEATLTPVRKDRSTLEFRLDLPAGQTVELRYRLKKSNVKA